MSIPTTTNFIANNSNYTTPTDLINIFSKYSSIQNSVPLSTGYYYGNYDLSQIFRLAIPSYSGTSLSTNFTTSISGTNYDLAKIFFKNDFPTPILNLDSANYSSGTTWNNSGTGGSTYNATLYNSPTFTSSGYSSYFTLNGTTQYFTATRSVQDDFTWNVWFKTTTSGGTLGQWWQGLQLVGNDINTSTSRDFGVSIGEGYLMFGCGYGPGDPDRDYTVSSNSKYNDNKWHMVTGTREKSTGTIAIYVDSTLNNSYKTSTTSTLDGVPTTYFGREYFASQSFFPGEIAIIESYTSVLTSDQIKSIYDDVRNRYPL
jgi:hypothetical protein